MAEDRKRLIEYLPPFLAEYREYRRIFDVLQTEIDDLVDRTEDALDNTFIATANEEGIRHWEKMLGVVPSVEATLEDRREIIRMKLVGDRPYTYRKLAELLDKLLGADGYHMAMTGPFELEVAVELTSRFQFAAAGDLLARILPANIVYTVTLRYRQYRDFNGIYIHGEMAQYTHAGLKEVV